MEYISKHRIGDSVKVLFMPSQLCHVFAVRFTESKVRYDVIVTGVSGVHGPVETVIENVDSALIEDESKPCPKCGQSPAGQAGEYPCEVCGLPTVHDEKKL